jgi:hypothetical protein
MRRRALAPGSHTEDPRYGNWKSALLSREHLGNQAED